MRDLKEQLQAIQFSEKLKLAETRAHPKQETKKNSGPKPLHRETVTISLGIDFGTTYTKAVWRNLNTDEAGAVHLPTRDPDTPFPESAAYVTDLERCLMPWDASDSRCIRIPYLKMHLTGTPIGTLPADLLDQFVRNKEQLVCHLAVFYLARIAFESRSHVTRVLSHEFVGRKVDWVVCVGVPDMQFDSSHKVVFERVARTAWQVSLALEQGKLAMKPTVAELRAAVKTAGDDLSRHPVSTYPEIGAAALSFLVMPSAQPGVYGYFDIGGGTLDGIAFRYQNRDGQRSIEYYSACVEPLGVDAIVYRLRSSLKAPGPKDVKSVFIAHQSEVKLPLPLDTVKRDVQTAVARVIHTARRCDGRDWIRETAQQKISEWLRGVDSLSAGSRKLILFIGGGGAESTYHRQWIKSTHGDRQHQQSGIPEYELQAIPTPERFSMDLPCKAPFQRIAVAYGLSAAITSPIGITGFPSQAQFVMARDAYRRVDFDARAREVSGEII